MTQKLGRISQIRSDEIYVLSSSHRLRGSASPVLTATGFVNGKGQFSTPHRINTPQPITKIFVTGDLRISGQLPAPIVNGG